MQKSSSLVHGAWLLAGVVVVIGLMVWLGSRNSAGETGKRDTSSVESVDHTWGPADAKITIVEYSDFQCPACASYHPAIKQLQATHADKVRFVYRHHPLYDMHPLADLAARASEAAHTQGKFWEMQDKLFTTQGSWTQLSGSEATNRFASFARELGINEEQFRRDLVSNEITSRVTRDMSLSRRAGVTGTPTFFINGEVVQLSSNYATLRATIDSLLAQQSN